MTNISNSTESQSGRVLSVDEIDAVAGAGSINGYHVLAGMGAGAGVGASLGPVGASIGSVIGGAVVAIYEYLHDEPQTRQ